jgi:hypothetical protein
MMVRATSIGFARPVSTIGWGGDKARTTIVGSDADIAIDLDARVCYVRPQRGTGIVVPLENVTQWTPQPEPEPKPKTSRA